MALFFFPFRPLYNSDMGVIPGAQLWFTHTGTDVPAPVFTDKATTIPSPNPVIANGFGRFDQIYLDSSLVYRVRGYDWDAEVGVDTPIEEYDPYNPVEILQDVMTDWLEGDHGDVIVGPEAALWTVESAHPPDGTFDVTGGLTTTSDAFVGDGVVAAPRFVVVKAAAGQTAGLALRTGSALDPQGVLAFDGANVVLTGVTGTAISLAVDDIRIAHGGLARLLVNADRGQFTVPLIVPDETYGPAWNNKMEAPTKNSVWGAVNAAIDAAKLTDGDHGDVVVTGRGAGLTVESATPGDGSFDVAGSLTASGNGVIGQSTNLSTDLTVRSDGSSGVSSLILSGPGQARIAQGSTGLGIVAAVGNSAVADVDILGRNISLKTGAPGSGTRLTSTALNLTSFLPVIVPDEVYGPAWDGKLDVPTKNAVFDMVAALPASLPIFTTTVKGLAPASGGGTANFLRADGAWAAPPAGGGGGSTSDAAYGPGWDGATTVSPSQNAVYDKIETLLAGSASDVAYGPTWDGVVNVAPSKNAVYDKLVTVDAAIAGKADAAGTTTALNAKVAKAGDTMTGDLAFNKAAPTIYLTDTVNSATHSIQAQANLAFFTPGLFSFSTDGVPRAAITDQGISITGQLDATTTIKGASLYTERPDGGAVYFGTAADNVYIYWNKTSMALRAPSWAFVRSSDNGSVATIDSNGNLYATGAVLAGNISMTNATFATITMGAGPMARVSATPGLLTLRSNSFGFDRESDGASLMTLSNSGALVAANSITANTNVVAANQLVGLTAALTLSGTPNIQMGPGGAYGYYFADANSCGFYKGSTGHIFKMTTADGALTTSGNVFAQTNRRCFQQGSPGIGPGAEIFMATAAPAAGDGNNGDIWLQYV